MIGESIKRLDFKIKILPDLEVLFQFSLWLTRNGRDATRLMREAMAEAYASWDVSTLEKAYVRFHNILTRRFCREFQRHALSPHSKQCDNVSEGNFGLNRLNFGTTTETGPRSASRSKVGERIDYSQAIAGLPGQFRSVMILSYLEGFSNRQIADLVGVGTHEIESLLNRGRRLLREGIFADLMGNNGLDSDVFKVAATA